MTSGGLRLEMQIAWDCQVLYSHVVAVNHLTMTHPWQDLQCVSGRGKHQQPSQVGLFATDFKSGENDSRPVARGQTALHSQECCHSRRGQHRRRLWSCLGTVLCNSRETRCRSVQGDASCGHRCNRPGAKPAAWMLRSKNVGEDHKAETGRHERHSGNGKPGSSLYK